MKKEEKKFIWLVLTVLILAFFVRFWGIGYGLPNFFIGDEQALIGGALKMAELRTLLPVFHPEEFRLMYYPPLIPYFYLIFLGPFILIKYLLGDFSGLIDLKNSLVLNPGSLWLIARLIGVLFGTATVYLIYLIGKKIFNKWIGLLSALFLALSFLHLQLSHFARHWIPALFFAYGIIYLAFSLLKNRQRKYYFLIGLTAGLAFGVSYIAVLPFLIFLIVHFFSSSDSLGQKIKDKNLWLTLIIFIALSSIFVLLHPQEFFRIAIGQDSTLAQTKNLIGLLSSFGYYFQALLFYEPVILIFSLLGWLILWLRSKKQGLLFLFWPVFYILVLYFFFHHEPRYMIFIIPWLSLLAGYGLYFVSKKISGIISKELVFVLVLLLVFIYPLTVAIKYDYLLSQKDTRILAKEWIKKNISEESGIITNWSGIKLLANQESILFQKEIDEGSLRTDDRVLLSLDEKSYPRPAFNVLRLHFVSDKLPNDLSQYIKENNYHYFLVQYWEKENLTKQDRSIIEMGQLVKKFSSGLNNHSIDINGVFLKPVSIIFSLKRFGPIVEIYEL